MIHAALGDLLYHRNCPYCDLAKISRMTRAPGCGLAPLLLTCSFQDTKYLCIHALPAMIAGGVCIVLVAAPLSTIEKRYRISGAGQVNIDDSESSQTL